MGGLSSEPAVSAQFAVELDSLIANWANSAEWRTTPVGYQAPAPFGGGDYAGLPLAATSPGLHLMPQAAVLGGGYAELKQSVSDGLILQSDRKATDAKAAYGESRRWRDGAVNHPPHYRLRHIDIAYSWPYPDGIHFKTRGYAGKQTSQTRENHSGAIQPASALGMEMKAMQRATNQQYSNTSRAACESRRWRDGELPPKFRLPREQVGFELNYLFTAARGLVRSRRWRDGGEVGLGAANEGMWRRVA